MPTWKVELIAEAQADFNRLDGSVKKRVLKQLVKLEQNPKYGDPLGNKAGINLEGYFKLYADKRRIRIIYEKIDHIIKIIAIDKREDMEVSKADWKMKIVTIVGARPQFIKAAPVSRAIKSYNQENHSHKITEILIHTGQHHAHNMSQIFFDQLNIHRPQYNLGVGSGSHGKMTGMMLAKLEAVFMKEKPDFDLFWRCTKGGLFCQGPMCNPKRRNRVDRVEVGWNHLGGANIQKIVKAFNEAIANSPNGQPSFYGNGRASELIVAHLVSASDIGQR